MSNQYRLYRHANGYFYHRVKVPADIRSLFGKEIQQTSLRTRDFREAVKRLPAVIVEVDRLFSDFRAGNVSLITSRRGSVSAEPLLSISLSSVHHRQVAPFQNGDDDLLATIKRAVRDELSALPVTNIRPQELPDPHIPTSSIVPVHSEGVTNDAPEQNDLPPLSEIAPECFGDVGRQKNWSAKTTASRKFQIGQVIEICGDKPLNRYTQSDIRLLKTVLFSLPPQSHGKQQFRGLSKIEIAEIAKKLGLKGLSAESVRQIMTAMNIVFGWARVEYDLGLNNIVQPMIPPPSSTGLKKDKRHGFSVGELQKLFAAPVFSGVESELSWLKPGCITMQHTGKFWVPFLAVYAGARLMEAVQLLREDIGCDEGIWFIDINDDAACGKRLKNVFSKRKVPVHPTLHELGFVEFVSTIPPGERLFADIEIGPSTQRHRYASKMFNKLLKVAGIKGPKKVWHSLRHSFEQACRDSGVDSAIMDQLQGHSQHGSRETYGEGYGLAALNNGIQSIKYDRLDLSEIRSFTRKCEPK
jgi:integrase